MSPHSQIGLSVAPTDCGYLFRINTRGTALESEAFYQLASECLLKAEPRVVLDLTRCPAVDSTFLGCLVNLHKQCPERFAVCCPPKHGKSLWGATQLDTLLTIIEQPPAPTGEFEAIKPSPSARVGFGKHVMDCHRSLAEVPGPQQVLFGEIAERLHREIGERKNPRREC